MRILLLNLLLLFSTALAAQGIGKTETISCSADTAQQYALYLPSGYTAEKKNPLIIFLDPGARGDLPLNNYRSLAEEYGLVMAGSFSSRNFDATSSVKAFVAIYNDLFLHYSIDPSMVWIAGFSGGSRAASSIAMAYPQIAGVIACGAGFAGDVEPTNANLKAYAALVGDADMNFGELLDNSQYLSEKRVNNLLLVFKGDHRWPPVMNVGMAINWLMERAGKEEPVSTDKEATLIGSVKAKIDSGYLYPAWMEAGQLSKMNNYREKLLSLQTEIGNKKGFAVDKLKFENSMTEETGLMDEFSLSFSGLVYKNAYVEKTTWQTIAQKAADMKKDHNSYRQMAGVRAFGHCTLSCYEQYGHLMNDKLYTTAAAVAEVLAVFLPSDPQPYFFMARAAAALDNKKQAEKYLKQAVNNGLTFTDRVKKDGFFLKLFSEEELGKMFEK